MKSIAILALIGSASAVNLNSCQSTGMDGWGLSCVPQNSQLFATGMNGDEDLGQDIIMKGKPFHYNQQKAHEAPEEGSAAEEKAEAKEDEKMKEADAKAKKADAATKKVGDPEKVSVLETVIAKEHTTFYDKQNAPKDADLVALNEQVENWQRWVELPDCDGSNSKYPLEEGHGASYATCKVNPKVTYTGKKQAADAALDGLTPKAE